MLIKCKRVPLYVKSSAITRNFHLIQKRTLQLHMCILIGVAGFSSPKFKCSEGALNFRLWLRTLRWWARAAAWLGHHLCNWHSNSAILTNRCTHTSKQKFPLYTHTSACTYVVHFALVLPAAATWFMYLLHPQLPHNKVTEITIGAELIKFGQTKVLICLGKIIQLNI